jgi:SAM-dependent methyltransferase
MSARPKHLWFAATLASCDAPPSAAEPDAAPVTAVAKTDAPPTGTTAAAPPDTPAAEPSPDPSAEAVAPADAAAPDDPPALDIEYVPTPHNVVTKMLAVAKVKKTDVVYDLGCGDGRLLVAAAKKYGAKGYGFDLDPVRVEEARANVKKAGVEHLVTIEQKNIFDVDLSPATVVTLYLLPELNVRLIPQLQQLAPGARIVSHDFDMQGVDYEQAWTVIADHHRPPPKKREHYIYKWTAPLKVEAPIPE